MKKEKYAVFLDLDRTLMIGGVIPQVNIDAINEVRRQGSYVFLNTARSYAYIPEKVRALSFLDGFVAGIGTDLRLHGKQIFSDAMSANEVNAIARCFLGDVREVCLEGEDVVLWINPQRSSARNGVVITDAARLDTVYRDCRISKVYVGGHFTRDERAYFERDYLVFHHAAYTEFVKKGFGKAEGMRMMMDFLGLPMENCIAMGDSANDADMLKAAGISVAMGDAIPEIKQMCTYVSCNAADGGVAQALRKFILDI